VSERTLLLVRHGLPDYRGGKATDRVPGPVLTPTGFHQAEQAAAFLERYNQAEQIYASPLARTVQTAETLQRTLKLPLRTDGLLREWYRTEKLYAVNTRLGTWLRNWLHGPDTCSVVVSHASPLLSIIRQALYLPHFSWWVGGDQAKLRLATADRFEVSMASVFEVRFEAQRVTAECVFHPEPRFVNVLRRGPVRRYFRQFPRPGGNGEQRRLERPHYGQLIGSRTSRPGA
jgi:broad specificity phosphatase PhoE